MRFSEAKRRPVVSIASADTVGRLNDFIVDPAARRVAGLKLKATPGNGDLLPWANIKGFGVDAITVADLDAIVLADDNLSALGDKHHAPLNKRVLTQAGFELGALQDIDFDPDTGELVALILADGDVEGARLVAVGSYAVIVRA